RAQGKFDLALSTVDGAVRKLARAADPLNLKQTWSAALSDLKSQIESDRERQRRAQELEQQRQRETRERDRARLMAIARQVGGASSRKLKQFRADVQQMASVYAGDAEFEAIAGQIYDQIESALQAQKKPIPWRLIAGGVAVAAAVALAVVLVSWM